VILKGIGMRQESERERDYNRPYSERSEEHVIAQNVEQGKTHDYNAAKFT
jgi:hypothetical protein